MVSKKTRDMVKLLDDLALADRKCVAQKHDTTVRNLDTRIHTIRWKVHDARWLINHVKTLEARFPHIKRMMLPTKIDLSDEEEDLQ